jgi:hypothetical protein
LRGVHAGNLGSEDFVDGTAFQYSHPVELAAVGICRSENEAAGRGPAADYVEDPARAAGGMQSAAGG